MKQQEDIMHTLITASFTVHNNFLSISYSTLTDFIPRKEDATFHDHTKHLNIHA